MKNVVEINKYLGCLIIIERVINKIFQDVIIRKIKMEDKCIIYSRKNNFHLINIV